MRWPQDFPIRSSRAHLWATKPCVVTSPWELYLIASSNNSFKWRVNTDLASMIYGVYTRQCCLKRWYLIHRLCLCQRILYLGPYLRYLQCQSKVFVRFLGFKSSWQNLRMKFCNSSHFDGICSLKLFQNTLGGFQCKYVQLWPIQVTLWSNSVVWKRPSWRMGWSV